MDRSADTDSTKKASDSPRKETDRSQTKGTQRSGSSGPRVTRTNPGSSIKKLRQLISLKKNKLLRTSSAKKASAPRLEESIVEEEEERQFESTQHNGTKTAHLIEERNIGSTYAADKGPANKQQEISASKKANSSTVKSDHTTSKNAKHMAGASVKTAKVKSPENKSEKPHSAAAIRQTVSQRRCRRSDTPDDDKILPLCSAQSVMTSKVNTHKLEANMRRRSRRLKEYSFVLTSIVFTLVFIIFGITTLGWYLAFTAHKTVGFELAMREPLNAAWKSSSPFKMRRKFFGYFEESGCTERGVSSIPWTNWSACRDGRSFRWKVLHPGTYAVDGPVYQNKQC